jgi:hypothetical protein
MTKAGMCGVFIPDLPEPGPVIFCIDNARVIYTNNHCYYPGTILGITQVSSVSNSLYFLTLPLVSVMLVIYTSKGMQKMFGVCVIH